MYWEDEEDFSLLKVLKLAHPEIISSLEQVEKALAVMDEFCEANNFERLPLDITMLTNTVCKGRYDQLNNELTVFLDEDVDCKWGDCYEMVSDDGSPLSVALHEFGHWVHLKLLKGIEIPEGENLLSLRDDKNKNSEMFAEAFRLFVTSPNSLKLQNPTRHAWLSERLKLPSKDYGEGYGLEYSKMKNGKLLQAINKSPKHEVSERVAKLLFRKETS
jgi:hypothetical protein